ncbi:hypothetical protein I7I48_05200 [Histoplasma ohiense]|nr:hypothetical protein I7I48_05200 [Histoplasma ohiense (nom. inval.)]
MRYLPTSSCFHSIFYHSIYATIDPTPRVCFNVQYGVHPGLFLFDFNLIHKPFPVVLMESPIG